MKTYILKKDLPGLKAGEISFISGNYYFGAYDFNETEILDREWFEEIVENKIDFSRFIQRSARDLIIKGDNYLVSWGNGNMSYYEKFNFPKDSINYIETELKDFKKGDVFILKSVADKGDFNKSDFKIYVGQNSTYIAQYLDNFSNIEYITNGNYLYTKVYKFLRD